jgi:hypothetical protein
MTEIIVAVLVAEALLVWQLASGRALPGLGWTAGALTVKTIALMVFIGNPVTAAMSLLFFVPQVLTAHLVIASVAFALGSRAVSAAVHSD